MKTIKLIVLCIYSILLFQCKVVKGSSENCNENTEFKNTFMLQISSVENYTLGKGDRKQFDDGLAFLSKYVNVSYEEMMNFSNGYTNLSAFEKDKKGWLKWYEENKCNNIQFK